MKKHALMILTAMFITAVSISISTGRDAVALEKKNFAVYYSFEGNTSALGNGAAELREIMTLTVNKLMKETDYNINFMIAPTWKDIFKKMKSGKADLAIINTSMYPRLIKEGFKIYPVASPVYGKDEKTCIYVNSKKNIKTMKDLKGKKLAISKNYMKRFDGFPSNDRLEYLDQLGFAFDFYELQYLMNKANEGNIWDSGIKFVIDYPNTDSRILALERGLADASIEVKQVIEIYRLSGNPLKNVKELYCSKEDYHGITLVAYDKVDHQASNKILNVLEDITRNPDKEMIEIIKKANLQVGKVGFVPSSDKDFDYSQHIWDESDKNGWEKNINNLVKKLIDESKKK